MREPIEQRFPRPSVMGVVNVTPDSFSDGGVHLQPASAVAAGWRMLKDGAAIVDVGGESTRPGSEGVSVDEELRRVRGGGLPRRGAVAARTRGAPGRQAPHAPEAAAVPAPRRHHAASASRRREGLDALLGFLV